MCKLANEKKVLGGGMHNEQCTMHNAQWTMHNAQCTMHNEQWTMNNAQCTMHNA